MVYYTVYIGLSSVFMNGFMLPGLCCGSDNPFNWVALYKLYRLAWQEKLNLCLIQRWEKSIVHYQCVKIAETST